MERFELLSEKNRARYLKIVTPVGHFLNRFGFHPHILSIMGLLLSIAAGIVYCAGNFFWASWVVVLAGISDTLDGQLARDSGKGSEFGAFFDSTLDRYGEMFLLMGLVLFFSGGSAFFRGEQGAPTHSHDPWAVLFGVMAMAGSFMVSYSRARAEGLGFECRIGLMQRPERMTLLVLGSLLGSIPIIGMIFMKMTLLVLALSTNFTAIHRMVYVRKKNLAKENQVP